MTRYKDVPHIWRRRKLEALERPSAEAPEWRMPAPVKGSHDIPKSGHPILLNALPPCAMPTVTLRPMMGEQSTASVRTQIQELVITE
jgi:hypothetical protein